MASRRPMGKPDEVCEFAGISLATLYDQRHRGVGLGSLGIKVGKHLRFRWEDIDRFLDEQAGKITQSEPRRGSSRRHVAPRPSQSGDGDRAA